MRQPFLISICCLVVALGGCSRSETPDTRIADDKDQAVPPGPPMAPVNTCELLTNDEIVAVQGEPPQDAKPSEQPSGGLMMYDCLFTLPTFTNSISVSVAQSATGAGARDARQAWRETFAAAQAKASEKSPPPRRIEGIGEEAFWTGNDRMGALYVLKGSRYLRISVGGPGEQGARIDKCRSLAEAALKHL